MHRQQKEVEGKYGILLNRKGDLVTKDIEKVKGVFATLTLAFAHKTCPQEFQDDKNLLKHI